MSTNTSELHEIQIVEVEKAASEHGSEVSDTSSQSSTASEDLTDDQKLERHRQKLLKKRTAAQLLILQQQREQQEQMGEQEQYAIMYEATVLDEFESVCEKIREMTNVNKFDHKGQNFLHQLVTIPILTKSQAFNSKIERIIDFLIEKGLNLESQDNLGKTALHFAAEKRNEHIFLYLVEKGASIHVDEFTGAFKHNTPVYTATMKKMTNLLKYLVEHKDVFCDFSLGYSEADYAFDNPIFDIPDEESEISKALFSAEDAEATQVETEEPESEEIQEGEIVDESDEHEQGDEDELEVPTIPAKAWDMDLFKLMCDNTPDAVLHFFDLLCEKTFNANDQDVYAFSRFRAIYGYQRDIRETPINIIAESKNKTKLIKHKIVQHALDRKWENFAAVKYAKEFMIFLLFLSSIFVTTYVTMAADQSDLEWYKFSQPVHYGIAVTKIICWVLLAYHIIGVEFVEMKNENNWLDYFKSFWNWINMTSYALLVLTIPLDILDHSNSISPCCVALSILLLLFNLLQFLELNPTLGTFVSMVGKMFHDVRNFMVFFLIFQVGFSVSFHILMHDVGAHGKESFWKFFVTVYLYSQGAFDVSDQYSIESAPKRYLAVFLLLVYTIVITLMLMNLLVALMASTYERVQEDSEGELKVIKAVAFLRIEGMLTTEERETNFYKIMNDMQVVIEDIDDEKVEEKGEEIQNNDELKSHFDDIITSMEESHKKREKELIAKIDHLNESRDRDMNTLIDMLSKVGATPSV